MPPSQQQRQLKSLANINDVLGNPFDMLLVNAWEPRENELEGQNLKKHIQEFEITHHQITLISRQLRSNAINKTVKSAAYCPL
jgi:hypothetical protein